MVKVTKFLYMLSFIMFGVNANAGLIGQVMEVHTYVPPSPFFGPGGTYYSTNFLVSDEVEIPLYGVFNEKIIDVFDNRITIDHWRTGTINSYFGFLVFQDVNLVINDIVDVSLNADTDGFINSWGGLTEFDESRIAFDVDNIYIDFSGIGTTANTHLSLDIKFASVAEPSAILLFGSGLIALILSSMQLRRRRHS